MVVHKNCVQVGRSRLLWAETESVQHIYVCIDASMVVWVLILAPSVHLLQEAKEQQGKKTKKKERKKENQEQCIFSGW